MVCFIITSFTLHVWFYHYMCGFITPSNVLSLHVMVLSLQCVVLSLQPHHVMIKLHHGFIITWCGFIITCMWFYHYMCDFTITCNDRTPPYLSLHHVMFYHYMVNKTKPSFIITWCKFYHYM